MLKIYLYATLLYANQLQSSIPSHHTPTSLPSSNIAAPIAAIQTQINLDTPPIQNTQNKKSTQTPLNQPIATTQEQDRDHIRDTVLSKLYLMVKTCFKIIYHHTQESILSLLNF